MKRLLITLLFATHATPVHALFLHQPLNKDYSLIGMQSGAQNMLQKGLYTIDLSYRGSSIGLARDFRFGAGWRSSIGVLVSDDWLQLATARSMVNAQGRSLDLNQWLGAQARIEFSQLMPYLSVGYRYSNDDNLMLDVVTSLKVFQVDSSQFHLSQPLGEALQRDAEMMASLGRQLGNELDGIFAYPVLDTRFNYAFN